MYRDEENVRPDYSGNNKLYELATTDEELSSELRLLKDYYNKKVQSYVLEIANDFGIELDSDCFVYGDDAEVNYIKDYKLRIIGMLLKKKPEIKNQFYEYLDNIAEDYALDLMKLAERHDIVLDKDATKKITKWTGIA